jgi:hypothetical protein
MAKEVKVDHLHKLTIKFVNSYYFSQTYGDDSYNDSIMMMTMMMMK